MSEEMDNIIIKQMGLREDKLKVMGYGTVKLYYHGTSMDSFSIELTDSFHSRDAALLEADKFGIEHPELIYDKKARLYVFDIGTYGI